MLRIKIITLLLPLSNIAFAQTTTVIDNIDSNFEILSGNWETSSFHRGFHGNDYLYNNDFSEFAEVQWHLPSNNLGQYRVYFRWSSSPRRTRSARYTVVDKNGETVYQVDQRRDGGEWYYAGIFDRPSEIRLSNEGSNANVIADAVRTELIEAYIDSDLDGVFDVDETNILGSDPFEAFSLDESNLLNDGAFDSDNDGISNKRELDIGTDPLDPLSFPELIDEENQFLSDISVDGSLVLNPQNSRPFACTATSRGAIYFDNQINAALFCNGDDWQLFTSGIQGETGPQGPQGEQGSQLGFGNYRRITLSNNAIIGPFTESNPGLLIGTASCGSNNLIEHRIEVYVDGSLISYIGRSQNGTGGPIPSHSFTIPVPENASWYIESVNNCSMQVLYFISLM